MVGQVRRTSIWLKLPSSRAGKSGTVVFVRIQSCGPRRSKTDIPAGLHGKHLQAVSTKERSQLVGVVFVV